MFTGCNFDTIISCLYFELLIHDVFDKGWVTQSNKDQFNSIQFSTGYPIFICPTSNWNNSETKNDKCNV